MTGKKKKGAGGGGGEEPFVLQSAPCKFKVHHNKGQWETIKL